MYVGCGTMACEVFYQAELEWQDEAVHGVLQNAVYFTDVLPLELQLHPDDMLHLGGCTGAPVGHLGGASVDPVGVARSTDGDLRSRSPLARVSDRSRADPAVPGGVLPTAPEGE